VKRIIILIIVAAALGALWFWADSMGYLERISPERIYETRDQLLQTVQQRLVTAALAFVLIYFVSVALSVPGASLLTITGGFLFGPWLGVLLVNLGATSGALAIFLAARYFMGEKVQEKYGERLESFNREIETNGSSYLLTLRFIPLVPFFLINLFSGFTTVKTRTFLWTTALGIIPGSFAYAWLGYSGTTLEEGQSPWTPEIIIALALLVVVSLIPVVYRKAKARRERG
jgi:uncharacterized membrane protein YdjX (TVP38/TMEM64 family)